MNKFPQVLKIIISEAQFKARLKHVLVSKAFHSINESMASRWDDHFEIHILTQATCHRQE